TPRAKKSNSKEKILIPLPIQISDPDNLNLENVSKTLPGEYYAVLIDKRIYVTDEWQAKVLFNCGYFGKGEFSRGEPSIKKPNANEEQIEFSINFKNLITINEPNFEHKKELIESSDIQTDSFDSAFKTEFVKTKVQTDSKHQYYRLNLNETSDHFYKTPNNPFNFKIKSLPSITLKESLSLMYEEAFFLKFGLDCLNIFKEKNPLSIDDLWKIFISYDPNFAFKYAVYHKLRSKGWVLKYGIKYGCDFLVYYEGPDRYHASYSVQIKIKDLNAIAENDTDLFTQFSSLVRINETASKDLMLCYAVYDSTELSLDSVECLAKISVMEMFVNRWVPEENRSNQTEEPSKICHEFDD
ncbi:tRNA-splicing endonuclease subunit Sen2, partial [Brachionus plicatilis]